MYTVLNLMSNFWVIKMVIQYLKSLRGNHSVALLVLTVLA